MRTQLPKSEHLNSIGFALLDFLTTACGACAECSAGNTAQLATAAAAVGQLKMGAHQCGAHTSLANLII